MQNKRWVDKLRHRTAIWVSIIVAFGGAVALATTAGFSRNAVASTGNAIPSVAIPRLHAIALRFAAENGDATPLSINAVAVTHGKALTIATPGDYVTQDTSTAVYLVTVKGHFRGLHLPVPPGKPAPTGAYLSIVLNATTFRLTDLGLNPRKPPVPLAHLGPITNLKQ